MTALAVALPAGPGEPSVESFPTEARNRLRYDLGLVLVELRAKSAPLAALAAGPWLVLIAIASRWQSHAEAWPSQETIAAFCGCSTRSVRTYVATLERAGLLRLRRTHQPNGRERIYYAPGFVLLRELRVVDERFPRDRMRKAVRVDVAHVATSTIDDETPDLVAAETPDRIAGELTEDQEPSSSCASVRAEPTTNLDAQLVEPTQAEEQEVVFDGKHEASEQAPSATTTSTSTSTRSSSPSVVEATADEAAVEPSEDDRAIARVVLGDRLARKYPGRALPRWFDRADVEHVARCTMLLDGDHDAKIAAHRGALDAAFAASKNGPPTVKFVWGSIEHFLGHVERGRALERKRVARTLIRSEAPTKSTRSTSAPPSVDERAKMRADMARLFGEDITRPRFDRLSDQQEGQTLA